MPTVPLADDALLMTGRTAATVEEFRGAGEAATKSTALFPVSVVPPPSRKMAVLEEGEGAGKVSAASAVPNPTKSSSARFPSGDRPVIRLVERNKATLPLVALIWMVPLMSTAGSAAPADPLPSPIRKYFPAATVPERAKLCHVVPFAEVYCNDHPDRLTAVPLRL